MMVVSFLLCIGAAAATIALPVQEALRRRRIKGRTMKDSRNTAERISNAVEELFQLPLEQRGKTRRMIAREILLDLEFMVELVFDDSDEYPPKDPQVLARTRDVLHQIVQLRWELYKALFLFRFRPRLVGDCQRIVDAACRYCLLWLAYGRLLKAKYPELYGEIPDT